MKKSIISLIILVIFIFLLDGTTMEIRRPLRYSKVMMNIDSKQDIINLHDIGIFIERSQLQRNSLTLVLDEKDIRVLQSTGIDYDLVIDDMAEFFTKKLTISKDEIIKLQKSMSKEYKIKGFEFGSMGGHYTFSELVAELDSMRTLYPHLISEKQSIGTSVESRDIWMVKISDSADVDESEPQILYTALHHAREPMGMTSVVFFMYHLLESYETDPMVKYVVDNRELYFVPCVNPDGYTYNQSTNPTGGGMWRKNKCDNDSNKVFEPDKDGVDLNRNYGYEWGIGSNPNPWNVFYPGKAAFSEPESKAIRDLCLGKNFKLALNYHSAWEKGMYLPPFAYNDTRTPEPDASKFDSLGTIMTQYNDYGWWIPTPADPYPAPGEASDWMYGDATNNKNKIFAITVEVGPRKNEFWPKLEEIYPIAHENVLPNLKFAFSTDVVSSISSPQYTSIPEEYLLSQNYPNPFNPSTTIEFDLPKSSEVRIDVYNTTGQKIRTLLNEKMLAGSHRVEFNATNLSSGVYFYRIEADDFQDVKKMILLK